MPSQRRGFRLWTGSLCKGFHISVLITAHKLVTVPALIYKELVYADLNDFLTKLVWIRSLFLPFQGSSILTTCQFELMTAPAYGLPSHFCLLKLFGFEGFSLVSSVRVCVCACVCACAYLASWLRVCTQLIL